MYYFKPLHAPLIKIDDQEAKDLYSWITNLTYVNDHEDVDLLEDDDDTVSLYSDNLR